MAAPLGRRKAPLPGRQPPSGRRQRFAQNGGDLPQGTAGEAEISPEMWTPGQGFEQGGGILPLARSASYVTISSPKTIRELSHVD
jgi:hypothetical protein